MRAEFAAIVEGWALVDDFDALTDRIERAAEWTAAHGGLEALEPDERATTELMIQTQIAKGIRRGDFWPYFGPGDEEVLL